MSDADIVSMYLIFDYPCPTHICVFICGIQCRGDEESGGKKRATWRWWISFWVDTYKTKMIVYDMVRLTPILKLINDLRKRNLNFQLGRVFPNKRVNLP